MGSLRVRLRDSSGKITSLWSRSGSQGREWKKVQLPLPVNASVTFKVLWFFGDHHFGYLSASFLRCLCARVACFFYYHPSSWAGSTWRVTVSVNFQCSLLSKELSGKSDYGDIAIDDISFSNKICKSNGRKNRKDFGLYITRLTIIIHYDLKALGKTKSLLVFSSNVIEINWFANSGVFLRLHKKSPRCLWGVAESKFSWQVPAQQSLYVENHWTSRNKEDCLEV